MPSLVDPIEIADLAARYGTPLHWERSLEVSAKTVEERRRKDFEQRGEVVFAVPRPGRRVLLHTKAFYPPGAYRLLSGGIIIGERVEAAAQREIREETGLATKLARMLGVVEYKFRHDGAQVEFVSYVFSTTKTTGSPRAIDEQEQIAGFRDVAWSELEQVGERLENLSGDWHDWGVFRAIPHRLVLQAIRDLRLES